MALPGPSATASAFVAAAAAVRSAATRARRPDRAVAVKTPGVASAFLAAPSGAKLRIARAITGYVSVAAAGAATSAAVVPRCGAASEIAIAAAAAAKAAAAATAAVAAAAVAAALQGQEIEWKGGGLERNMG